METAMTPQERQLVDDLFDRLSKVDAAPRDPYASAAIAQGLRRAPNATYALVQTVLLQDEALRRANERIQQLESTGAGEQRQSGGFLDSMRETLFGSSQDQPRGSVPNVPPPTPNRPVWNSGQVLHDDHYGQPPFNQPQYNQSPYGQQPYGQQPYGQQPYGMPQSPFGGGGSFLGTAAAAAAGVVGGSLLLGSIRNMMGGHHHSFADAGGLSGGNRSPWTDQSDSSLARDAGINDIASAGSRDDGGTRAGLFDQASNDTADRDDMDLDSDDFGGNDNGSDYA